MSSVSRNGFKGERGFSLLNLLVAGSIGLLCVVLVSRSMVHDLYFSKLVGSKLSSGNVYQNLGYDLLSKVHNELDDVGNCINLNKVIKNNTLGGKSQYTILNPSKLKVSSPPTFINEALSRCSQSRLPSDITDANQNNMYFCIHIESTPSHASDSSLVNSEMAFAEVSMELVDLNTFDGLSCTEYKVRRDDTKDRSAGIALAMTLYWTVSGSGVKNFNRRNVSLLANPNP
ncbi:hypothetical protein [Pseudobacteriovorax antillogorgiicola]|uniref:Uncharacterized protein n=1 Tax=Pseudobacteriovorax antillogorgiicola TaxID=1513793 RepID=A0A1Y6CJ66_9BACT|nr:hypothetical protein [Pseudobacteriovorax antillogorgiicola]TCS46374.1 hypothetical protein EDD56_12438 [Pseudobacteriovorax antillogorgiicola]SMF68564.1 hypothetical protein SAMN06296036_12438 [Pseudobacteriovorax antillogorgiicola]